MLLRVTCAGLVVGAADFPALAGVAHAQLMPTAAYVHAADSARRLGLEFGYTQYWSPLWGDFADEAATRWAVTASHSKMNLVVSSA